MVSAEATPTVWRHRPRPGPCQGVYAGPRRAPRAPVPHPGTNENLTGTLINLSSLTNPKEDEGTEEKGGAAAPANSFELLFIEMRHLG